jgi:hypothetical protein
MRSIPQILIWELSLRSWSVVALFVLANALPLLVFTALSSYELDQSDPTMTKLFKAFQPMIVFLMAIGILMALGPASRLYSLPISNNALVSFRLVVGWVFLIVELALVVVLYSVFFNLPWPLLSSVLYGIVCWATGQMVVTAPARTVSGFLLSSIPLVLSTTWLHFQPGGWFSPPTALWIEVSAGQLVIIGCIVAFSHLATVDAVRRDRCGEYLFQFPTGQLLSRVGSWIERRLLSQPASFSTSQQAQDWHEQVTKGMGLPLVYSLISLVIVAATLCNPRNWIGYRPLISIYESWVVLGYMLTPLAALTGFIAALSTMVGKRQERFQDVAYQIDPYDMSTCQAVLPITSTQFAFATLKMALKSVLTTWAFWLCGFIAIYLLINFFGVTRLVETKLTKQFGSWFLPLTVLGPWVALTSVTVVMQSPSRHYAIWVGVSLIFVYVIFSIVALERLPPAMQNSIHLSLLGVTSTLLALAAILAFISARYQQLLGGRSILWALITFVVLLSLAIATSPWQLPFVGYIAVTCFCLLTVAPLAFAPLAVAANRHRA